jgi:outer membrane protein assembly factor BamB
MNGGTPPLPSPQRGRVPCWLAVASTFVAVLGQARSQEWPRFRGPNGSGVSTINVPAKWTEEDYAWKASLPGKGHSSPVLWGPRLFVTSGDEKTGARIVLCLEADTGRQLWKRQFSSQTHGKHSLNSFASATPAVDEKRLYVSWATPKEYVVLALDHEGNELWRRDLGPFKTGHGFGVSPIVHDDLLVVANEQDGESSLVGLAAADGKIRWQVPRKSQVTYSTPCVYQPKGRSAEIIFTNWTYGITAVDPHSGKTNWETKVFSKDHLETAIGSPIVAGELVLGTCGYLGKGNHTVAVRPLGEADAGQAEEVYRVERGAPLTTTPLVVGELLFLWSDDGIVSCADAGNGRVHWQKRVGGTYYASPVCAGKHVYCTSVEGEVVVLAAAAKFAELARVPLGEPSNATPAMARGKMFLRTESKLRAISSAKN